MVANSTTSTSGDYDGGAALAYSTGGGENGAGGVWDGPGKLRNGLKPGKRFFRAYVSRVCCGGRAGRMVCVPLRC